MSSLSYPLVSVVIPFYNSTNYVLNAIRYLKNQTFTSFEVIFVDDGSEELDEQLIHKAINSDERFFLLKQSHQGAGVARNLGLDQVRGEYVIFLDVDDFFDKRLIEKMYSSAKRHDSDVVLCDASKENKQEFHAIHTTHLKKDWTPAEEVYEELFQLSVPAPWNKLIRTSLIKEFSLRFLPLQNSNDLTFTYSALAVAKRISWVNENLVMYSCSNPKSIQRTKDKNPHCIVAALEGLLNNLKAFQKLEQLRHTFLRVVVSNLKFNFRTCTKIQSRVNLLNALIDSPLYRDFVVPLSQEADPGDRDYLKQIETLRSTFSEDKSKSNLEKIKEKTKFTIIIPFYNVAQYISIPIQSLKKQTFRDFKVILIDDGSVDNSLEEATKLIAEDPRFFVVRQKNQGPSVSRNLGLSLANSDYILLLDSDDALTPKALERFNECIEAAQPDIVFFEAKPVNFYPPENTFGKKQCDALKKYYGRRGEYQGVLSGPDVMLEASSCDEFIASACLSVCRLSFLKENGIKFIPHILHEDNPYTFELLLKAKKVTVLKEKVYLRTLRPDSIMTKVPSLINVWGYYTGFMRTRLLLINLKDLYGITEDQSLAFQKVSFTLLDTARRLWREAPKFDLFFLFLPVDTEMAFRKTMSVKENKVGDFVLSSKEMAVIKLKRRVMSKIRSLLKTTSKK